MSEVRRPRRILRRMGMVAAGLLAVIVLVVISGKAPDVIGILLPAYEAHMNTVQKTITSKDGTTIAYEESGAGPPLILVSAALADRDGAAKLAKLLAENFTVTNYDRRGRGKSTDTLPYAVEREVEDLGALADAAGGSACLFGSSSGAVLALDAASELGSKVTGLFMYEPPFITDGSRPPMPDDFSQQINRLVAAGRRDDAVKLFFTNGMGIPGFIVTLMRLLMPGWKQMAAVAHTIPYDLAVLEGTQSGKALPAERWSANQAPTLVMVGSKSEAFFHTGAKALAGLLRHGEYRSLEGRDHSAVMMAPKQLAGEIAGYFSGLRAAAAYSERSLGNAATASRDWLR